MNAQQKKNLELNISETANKKHANLLIENAPKCEGRWGGSVQAAQEIFIQSGLSFRDAYLEGDRDGLLGVALCLAEIHNLY